jgi:hypothetical protein
MADNAPYSVNRPPFPNVHVNLPGRLEVYVATITTGASPAVVQSLSSAGIAVADTAAGRITVTFPAGGTGAVGWTMCSLFKQATPSGAVVAIDSDLDDYAAGSIEIETFADDANTTADDVDGEITLLIYVLKAVS